MPLAIHVHIVFGNVCNKFHSNILNANERFLSYGPRLNFLHDDEDDEHAAADDDAKAMTITRLFFLQKTDELINEEPSMYLLLLFCSFQPLS